MPYHYTDETRATDPHALPDIEVFHQDVRQFVEAEMGSWQYELVLDLPTESHSNLTNCVPLAGFYFAHGLPGCLWDSDPIGPFDTEAEALAEARSSAGE